MGQEDARRELAGLIDHTLLRADATPADIERLCDESLQYGFYAVCVNSSFVPLCVNRLKGTDVRIVAVTGFPLGAASTAAKSAETRRAVVDGADEIDMVLHIGRLKAGDRDYVRADIEMVVGAAAGRKVKVILETGFLDEAEKLAACQAAQKAGAKFVKTATGFGPGGATVDDVRLLRRAVGDELGVKASGGIRDLATARRMIAVGANRLGTSASVALIESLP
jgi:deoxyribose-phosphate aldolase